MSPAADHDSGTCGYSAPTDVRLPSAGHTLSNTRNADQPSWRPTVTQSQRVAFVPAGTNGYLQALTMNSTILELYLQRPTVSRTAAVIQRTE